MDALALPGATFRRAGGARSVPVGPRPADRSEPHGRWSPEQRAGHHAGTAGCIEVRVESCDKPAVGLHVINARRWAEGNDVGERRRSGRTPFAAAHAQCGCWRAIGIHGLLRATASPAAPRTRTAAGLRAGDVDVVAVDVCVNGWASACLNLEGVTRPIGNGGGCCCGQRQTNQNPHDHCAHTPLPVQGSRAANNSCPSTMSKDTSNA